MAGTVEGGRKAHKTKLQKYGKDFYMNIGRKGGKNGHTGGFASDKIGRDGLTGYERASVAGKKGGKISKRGPAKRFSADKIAKIKEELAEAEEEELKNRIRLLRARLERAQNQD